MLLEQLLFQPKKTSNFRQISGLAEILQSKGKLNA
jgi:hypothetical protein